MAATVADLLDFYEAEYLPAQAPGTQTMKRRLFRRFRRDFGGLPLDGLTPVWLRQWRDGLRAHCGPGTVGTYMTVLAAALTVAVDMEWIDVNPLRKVRRPPQPRGRVRW